MLRVETVFTSYKCPKLNQEVDIRIDRLCDVDSKRVVSQKFECDKSDECCLNQSSSTGTKTGCPHPDAKHMKAHREGAGS